MNLRPKTFLLIAATFLGLLTALVVSARFFLMGGFSDLEIMETRQNTERVLALIAEDLSGLLATSGDWAFWDDTYRFMTDRNETFVQGNLQPDTLVTLKINFMLFVDGKRNLVYSRFVDLRTQKATEMPKGFAGRILAAGGDILNSGEADKKLSGIIMDGAHPVLVAARPVLKSDLSGPANGTLILGRCLDQAAIGRLSAISRLTLGIHPASGPFPVDDREAAKAVLAQKTSVIIQPLGPETVAGFALQRDVQGQPAFIVKVSSPRHIHRQGLAALRYYIVFLVAAALPVLALLLYFMEKVVLKPLSRLSEAVDKAGLSGALGQPLIEARKDEIGTLASTIDRFLKKISDQNQALKTDIARRQQTEADLAEERDKLKAALDRVKTLSGLLPICANCKRIRNDQGYWEQIEVYVVEHSDAGFSHGICPECARKLYGDLAGTDEAAKRAK